MSETRLTDAQVAIRLRVMAWAMSHDAEADDRAACLRGAEAIAEVARLRSALVEMVRVAVEIDGWCDVEGCACSYETALVQARAALTPTQEANDGK
jgi:hypothetical protein